MNRLVLIAVLVAACASPGATAVPTGGPLVTQSPQDTSAAPTAVPPTSAPTATAAATPTAPPTGGPLGIVIGTDVSGTYLVTPDGFSLYTFDNDSPGESSCSGNCADNWPPFPTGGLSFSGGAGVSGTFADITRGDGITQVTYNDAPLYFFSGDSAAGQTNGDNVGGVWHLAKP